MRFQTKRPLFALGLTLGALAAAPAYAQDSDGDGALDTNDAYPCDASVAGVSFSPAEGQHAALLFEDQWPQLGDADFNDAVITYNYVVRENAAGEAVAITATFNALALGGVFDNGLGLHLPIAAANVGAVTRTVGTGAAQPLPVSTADTELTFKVSANLREVFGGTAGPINAIDGASVAGQAIQVDITLTTPTLLDMATAPFDVYIFRTDTPAHEVHGTNYTGTAAMDTALFNTRSDSSGPGLSFVDGRGLPFVLNIPQFSVYTKEGTDIAGLWPRILNFAATGGTQDQDFYAGDTVMAQAYAGTPAINPAFVSTETVDQSCLPAGPGSSASDPGVLCTDILAGAGVSGLADGIYWIDPDGSAGNAAFQGYCDMQDGGWLLLQKSDGPSRSVNDAACLNDPAQVPPSLLRLDNEVTGALLPLVWRQVTEARFQMGVDAQGNNPINVSEGPVDLLSAQEVQIGRSRVDSGWYISACGRNTHSAVINWGVWGWYRGGISFGSSSTPLGAGGASVWVR